MKYTYFISISKVGNTHHVLHNGTCQIYLSNKEDMIPLGRHEQFVVALNLARNNFQKVSPCPKCILKRRLYNLAATKRGPIPIKHLPDA